MQQKRSPLEIKRRIKENKEQQLNPVDDNSCIFSRTQIVFAGTSDLHFNASNHIQMSSSTKLRGRTKIPTSGIAKTKMLSLTVKSIFNEIELKNTNAVDAMKNKSTLWSKYDDIDENGHLSLRAAGIPWEIETMQPFHLGGRVSAQKSIAGSPELKRSSIKFEDISSSWGHFEFLENGLSLVASSVPLDNQENLVSSRSSRQGSIENFENEYRNDLIFELEL